MGGDDALNSGVPRMTVTHRHRVATPDDARGIFSVLAEVAPEIPVRIDTCGRRKNIFGKVREWTSSGDSLVAIDSDGRVVGFLLVEPDQKERFFYNNMALHLPYAGVTTSWRDRKIFSAVIRQVMTRNVPLTATVKAANQSAIATRLLRLGFHEVGPGSFRGDTNFKWQPSHAELL
jgi:hypothetical protein